MNLRYLHLCRRVLVKNQAHIHRKYHAKCTPESPFVALLLIIPWSTLFSRQLLFSPTLSNELADNSNNINPEYLLLVHLQRRPLDHSTIPIGSMTRKSV